MHMFDNIYFKMYWVETKRLLKTVAKARNV
jgi:hypothetical protein